MLKKLGILIFTLFLLVGCSFKNNVSSPKKERTPQEIMQIFKDNGYLLYESEYIVLLDLNRPNISFVYIDEYNGLFIPQRSMNSYNWIYDIAQIGKCGYYVDEKKVQSGECSKSDISEAINTKKFYLEELNAMSLTEEEVNALFKDIIDKKDSYKFDGIDKLDNKMGNVTESKSEVIPAEDTIKLKEPLILEINTNIEKPEYAISDSDYEKYNYIMDYLNKHLDKSEDVLFDELSDVYKESAESLKEFMNSVMQDAVDRDMG